MEEDKSLLVLFAQTARMRMIGSVLVVEPSTALRLPPMLDAVMVSIVAPPVSDPHVSLVDTVSHAERGASLMANCTGCKRERERVGKKLRRLTTLPVEVVKSSEFKNQKLPVNLCEYCDGAALDNALHTHDERSRPTTE